MVASRATPTEGNARRRGLRLGIVGVLVLSTVPVVGWSVLDYQRSRAEARDEAWAETALIATHARADQDAIVEHTRGVLQNLTGLLEVETSSDACNLTLAHVIAGSRRIVNLFVLDRDGVITCSALPVRPEVRDQSQRDFYQEAKADLRFTIGSYLLSPGLGIPIVVAALPIVSEGRFDGVYAATIGLGVWAEESARTGREVGAIVSVADAHGDILARSEDFEAYAGSRLPFFDAVSEHREGALLATGPDGVERFYAFEAIVDEFGNPHAYVVVGRSVADAFGPVAAKAQERAVTTASVVVVGFLGAWVVAEGTLMRQDRELRVSERRYRELSVTLERRVEERTAELKDANEDLESFAYSVSHDLRGPLRAVEGFSHILIEEHEAELSPKAKHYLQMVAEGATEMTGLIEALLQFSRAGRAALKRDRIDAAALVRGVFDELRLEREGRDVHLDVGDVPPLEGDPVLLHQVVTNLLSNALKFTRTRARAEISFGATRGPEGVVYHVKDNGVGFDMAHAERLFGIFQRLHRPEEFEGNGAGLAITKRIVERHGGRIWAEAVPDQGATFYFTVPGGTPA